MKTPKCSLIFLFALFISCFQSQILEASYRNETDQMRKWFGSSFDPDELRKLIGTVNVNAQDGWGFSALLYAASSNYESVKLLLSIPGININAQNNLGDNALIIAAHAGKESIVRLLLQFTGSTTSDELCTMARNAININMQNNNYGQTALMMAATPGIAKLLLQLPDININLKDKDGKTAYEYIKEKKWPKIEELFNKKLKELNLSKLETDQEHDIDSIRLLREFWFAAIESGKREIIEPLTHKININVQEKYSCTALMISARKGNMDVVKLLLQVPDINVNMRNESGQTALMWAAWNNHESIVKLLLTVPGIDINMQDNVKYTALSWAVEYGQSNIVKILLSAPNININSQELYGRTAYDIAGRPDIRKLIRQKIEELNHKALESIRQQDIESLKLIIAQLGPNLIDAIDTNGDTLLHKAFSANSADIILFLLQIVEDPREKLAVINKKGQTPLALINPTSPIFNLCFDIAFLPEPATKSFIASSVDFLSKFWAKKRLAKHVPFAGKQTVQNTAADAKQLIIVQKHAKKLHGHIIKRTVKNQINCSQ